MFKLYYLWFSYVFQNWCNFKVRVQYVQAWCHNLWDFTQRPRDGGGCSASSTCHPFVEKPEDAWTRFGIVDDLWTQSDGFFSSTKKSSLIIIDDIPDCGYIYSISTCVYIYISWLYMYINININIHIFECTHKISRSQKWRAPWYLSAMKPATSSLELLAKLGETHLHPSVVGHLIAVHSMVFWAPKKTVVVMIFWESIKKNQVISKNVQYYLLSIVVIIKKKQSQIYVYCLSKSSGKKK